MAAGFLSSLRVYREPRLVAILLMGFSSGLPLALTGATLSLRLAELGVSLTAIGLFTLVRFSVQLQVPVGAGSSTGCRCRGSRRGSGGAAAGRW